MKNRFLLISLFVIASILAACAAQPITQPDDGDKSTPTLPGDVEYLQAALATRETVAQEFAVPVEQVEILQVEPMEWPDSCLGLSKSDEMCLQVITPGYQVTLRVGQEEAVYRTNADGSLVIRAGDAVIGTPQS